MRVRKFVQSFRGAFFLPLLRSTMNYKQAFHRKHRENIFQFPLLIVFLITSRKASGIMNLCICVSLLSEESRTLCDRVGFNHFLWKVIISDWENLLPTWLQWGNSTASRNINVKQNVGIVHLKISGKLNMSFTSCKITEEGRFKIIIIILTRNIYTNHGIVY